MRTPAAIIPVTMKIIIIIVIMEASCHKNESQYVHNMIQHLCNTGVRNGTKGEPK